MQEAVAAVASVAPAELLDSFFKVGTLSLTLTLTLLDSFFKVGARLRLRLRIRLRVRVRVRVTLGYPNPNPQARWSSRSSPRWCRTPSTRAAPPMTPPTRRPSSWEAMGPGSVRLYYYQEKSRSVEGGGMRHGERRRDR